MLQEHDLGRNLRDEFIQMLRNFNIHIRALGRVEYEINHVKCYIIYNNASFNKLNGFSQYFWGYGKNKIKNLFNNGFMYFLLIGGRNFGNNVINRLLNDQSLTAEERQIIKKPRIEHSFILPFELIIKLQQNLIPGQFDQLKILISLVNDFEFRLNGQPDRCIKGNEIKNRYLNKFDLLNLDTKIIERILLELGKNIELFPRYLQIYLRANE